MDEPFEILLHEDPQNNSAFRTQNAPGETARRVLIDRGEALILRASLLSITHGDFSPSSDHGASLLVFEFQFLSMNAARRFKSARVEIRFEDASGNVGNRPEVWAIAPKGKLAINRTTSKKDVRHQANVGLNAGGLLSGVVGGEVGYVWEASQTVEKTHATTLTGTARLTEKFGRDNSVVWELQEDGTKKDGLPSFLRTAVLLRRKDDVPFRFVMDAKYEMDFAGKMQTLFGRKRADPVDFVQIETDGKMDLDGLGIEHLDEETTNMKEMDISKHADVVMASLLTTP